MLLSKSKLMGLLPMEKTSKKTHRGAETDALFLAYTLPGVSGEQPWGGAATGLVSDWSEQSAAASPTGHRHGPGVSRRSCHALGGSSGYRH